MLNWMHYVETCYSLVEPISATYCSTMVTQLVCRWSGDKLLQCCEDLPESRLNSKPPRTRGVCVNCETIEAIFINVRTHTHYEKMPFRFTLKAFSQATLDERRIFLLKF